MVSRLDSEYLSNKSVALDFAMPEEITPKLVLHENQAKT